MDSTAIRESFIRFFRDKKQHHHVPPCSLKPPSPNLLFTNAGMNQFVPIFLGETSAAQWGNDHHILLQNRDRAVNSQPCLRAGGKHNDFETVGSDTYHHTFFEMLGNWSFDAYWKQEAIEWAWELLTDEWHFPKARLYATVYQPNVGDPGEKDDESYAIWEAIFKKAGLDPKIHIVWGSKADNFWMMGETGPCGSCSEIHLDCTPDATGHQLVNQGDVRCIEIWNLVFMQYKAVKTATGNITYQPLDQRFVDTGMGLERIAGICATTNHLTDFSNPIDNYRSDLFTPIFDRLAAVTHYRYGHGKPEWDVAYRIIGDHIRAATVAIADGICPSNTERGYVIRKIIRRAYFYGTKTLKIADLNFLADLSNIVVQAMEHCIRKDCTAASIRRVIQNETENFEKALNNGEAYFQKFVQQGSITGGDIFVLQDTYGFPKELTLELAHMHSVAILQPESFAAMLEAQRQRSQTAQKRQLMDLSSRNFTTTFVGYDEKNVEVTAQVVDVVQQNTRVYVITDQSPFYGEKGGQMGDQGWLFLESLQRRFRVIDTQWNGNALLHEIVDEADPSLPLHFDSDTIQTQWIHQTAILQVTTRTKVAGYHTATHLLHWALRKHLGSDVMQAGSSITNHRLRFDFQGTVAINPDLLRAIEDDCNVLIAQDLPVETKVIAYTDTPDNCLHEFDGKYGEHVRMVSIGFPQSDWREAPQTQDGCDGSRELCGGTHAQRTGQLGIFHLLKYFSIGKNTWRIEAIIDGDVLAHCRTIETQCKELEIANNALKKQLHQLEQKYAQQQMEYFLSRHLPIKPAEQLYRFVSSYMPFETQGLLREFGMRFFNDHQLDLFAIAAEGAFCIFCSKRAIEAGYCAKTMAEAIAAKCQGNSGGKAPFAQGGTKDASLLQRIWNGLQESDFLQPASASKNT